MEVDGMYENTPWEHLALWAPWIGLAAIVAAIILAVVVRKRASAARFFPVAGMLGATGASATTLGILFTWMWRPAHDTYPTKFGMTAIWFAAVSLVIGLGLAVVWRSWRWSTLTYGMLTAAAAAGAAISAYSHSIIAEGQVTAMVLPVSYVVCALLATVIAAIKFDDPVFSEALSVLSFLALALFATYKLPVVQFHADSSLYPVTGAFYIVALGRLSRVWLIPPAMQFVGAIVAIAIGYLLAQWFGIAIAMVGVSISAASGLPRRPTEEFRLPHSTHA